MHLVASVCPSIRLSFWPLPSELIDVRCWLLRTGKQESTDRHPNGQPDIHYQVHYFPRFTVENKGLFRICLTEKPWRKYSSFNQKGMVLGVVHYIRLYLITFKHMIHQLYNWKQQSIDFQSKIFLFTLAKWLLDIMLHSHKMKWMKGISGLMCFTYYSFHTKLHYYGNHSVAL